MDFNCAVLLLFGVSIIADTDNVVKGKASQKNLVQPRKKQLADKLSSVNNTIQPRMACSSDNGEYFMIKSKKSNLVFDASNDVVKIQAPSKSATQLWSLEMAGLGKFYIYNRATGNVLDISGGGSPEAKLITYPKHCGPNQQWYINYSGITSAVKDFVVDLWHESYNQGNDVVVYPWHGRESELFTFEPV
ncbi:uncharacterized protein LOC123004059 [Tribolium madens]|uniref:uncharacterized protein LOC123004059 n=1 Tax=Tribolium madens TaxID=41895 RepID=UPI001CF7649C|nr:uncharacterized protein LOC123004059 [Tribolium madens]